MKVNVKNLQPNPFRRMDRYPIDREKIETLKISINETTFWDNILARPDGKNYQVAYGHHRLIALNELDIKEVDIPVRKLDDSAMIRIMANENMDAWGSSPAVINETVLTAKEFLDNLLKLTKNYDSLNNFIKSIVDPKLFLKLKEDGVGQTTILKFLGGNWKQWMIQQALDTLQSEDIDREAVEKFPTTEQARTFKKAVRKYKIPKKKQKSLAKALVKKGVSKREMEAEVIEYGVPDKLKTKFKEAKLPPDFSTFIKTLTKDMSSIVTRLKKAKPYLDHLGSATLDSFTLEGKTLRDHLIEIFPIE